MRVMVMRIAMAMIVMVCMPVHGAVAVGAAFGIERPINVADSGAQTRDHVGDDVVLANVEGARADFGGKVPVAEVPRNTRERTLISSRDLEQAFRCGFHCNDAAVVEPDAVAGAEHGGLG